MGARASITHALADRITFTTYGMLGWHHAFGDVSPTMTMAFASGGTGFDIGGISLARDAVLVEAGFNVRFDSNAMAGVSYFGQLSDRVSDQTIKGNLTWRF